MKFSFEPIEFVIVAIIRCKIKSFSTVSSFSSGVPDCCCCCATAAAAGGSRLFGRKTFDRHNDDIEKRGDRQDGDEQERVIELIRRLSNE